MATEPPPRPDDEEIHGEQQPRAPFGPDYDPNTVPASTPSDSHDDASSESPPGRQTDSSGQLRNSEENPGGPSPGGTDPKEGPAAGKLGGGFNPVDKFMPPQAKLLSALIGLFKSKKGRGGAAGVSIITILVLLFSTVHGPLQLIHLSHLLRGPTAGLERDKNARGTAMIRYWQTGDIGQTRVTAVGARIASKVSQDMERNGVRIGERNANGNTRTFLVDSSKYTETRGRQLGIQEQRRIIAKAEGLDINKVIPGDPVGRVGSGHRHWTLVTDFRQSANTRIMKNSLNKIPDGKFYTGRFISSQELRVMKRVTGLPRIFNPIALATHQKKAQFIAWAESVEERAKERRAERRANRGLSPKGAVATKIDQAKSSIRARPNLIKSAGWGLTFTAGACMARGIAGAVAWANRAAIVAPAMIEATHYTSVGDKVKEGDAYSEQFALEADFLQDKEGNTIWESRGINALSNPQAKGVDIDPQYKQAFSNHNVEQEINDKYGGGVLGGIACSTPGLAAQALIGAGLTFIGCSTVVGCSLAAGKFARSSVASYIAIAFLADGFVDILAKSDLDLETLSAQQRGNILAYGAREMANINSRASGGTPLSGTEINAMNRQQIQLDQEEFQSKSFSARMFDAYDHRSLISRGLIQKTSPTPSQNITKVANSLVNIGGVIKNTASSLFSFLLPNVVAQEDENYDWGFPTYGMPRDIFNNPGFADPYDNAEKVNTILEEDEDKKYKKKSLKCFGINISKDSEDRWQAVADEEEADVNPASKEYHKANCDEDDNDWKRIRMFIFDARMVDSISCLTINDEVGDESCANLEVDTDTTSVTDDAGVAGANIDLANIRKPSANIDCAPGTNDIGVYDGYTQGNKVRIRLCAIPQISSSGQESNGGYGVSGGGGKAIVNSRASGAWLELAKAASSQGIDIAAISSFRTMGHQQELCNAQAACSSGDHSTIAKPGTSNHQLGLAIDFSHGGKGGSSANCINAGGKCTLNGDATWEWLDENAQNFGIKQLSNEFWHWSPLEN